jgi:hypothetical protein
MTVPEMLQSVQFVVGQDGRPTAVILDMETWKAILAMLGDTDEVKLIRDRLENWPGKEAGTRWEDFEALIDEAAEE